MTIASQLASAYSRKRVRRTTVVSAAFACLCMCATPVWAHDPPATRAIAVHPDNPGLIAVHADTAGLIRLARESGRFELICNAFAGLLESGLDRVFMRYNSADELLVGSFRGLWMASSDACAWQQVGPAGAVRALVTDATRPNRSYALLSPTDTEPSRIVVTSDGGRTWTPVHAFEPGVRGTSMAVVTSDPPGFHVVVESGGEPDAQPVQRIATSSDGGTTWTERTVELAPFRVLWASHAELNRMLLVEQTGELSVRVHVWHQEGSGPTPSLDLTAFGGVTARQEDGTVWVGDAEGGLYRYQDGAPEFELVQAQYPVTCLEWLGGRLWACRDNWRQGHFAAFSEDEGRTFVPVERYACIDTLAACAQDMATTCEHGWYEWNVGVLVPARGLGLTRTCDAGPTIPEQAPPGNGCSASPARVPTDDWIPWMVFCLLWRTARSRACASLCKSA